MNARKEADAAKAQFVHPEGDHLTLLNVYHAYKSSLSSLFLPSPIFRPMLTSLSQSFHRCSPDEYEKNWAYNNFLSQRALQQADNVRSQLKRSMEKHDLDLVSTPFEDKSYYVNIRKALTAGFFMQVAHREGGKGEYVTIKDNQVVRIHKGSGLETTPDWVCFNEFVLTTSNVSLIPSFFPCLFPVRHLTLDFSSTDSPSSFRSPRSVHPDRHRDPARVATRPRAAVLQPRHL